MQHYYIAKSVGGFRNCQFDYSTRVVALLSTLMLTGKQKNKKINWKRKARNPQKCIRIDWAWKGKFQDELTDREKY